MSARLHVVAGVLRDASGRVLLAQRPAGKADAGLWEFPGGKVEPGETALDALRRELREELGVRIHDATPLIRVPAPKLHLDTWAVAGFDGEPIAYEHAALAWVSLEALGERPMPAVDRPVVAALRGPDRLLITPEPGDGAAAEAAWLTSLDAALARGLKRLHLRLPDARAALRARLAEAVAPRCRAAGAALYVHGDLGLAGRLGVGLHWRAGQLRDAGAAEASAAHRRAGLPLSAAVHDLLLGPVKPTATHPGHPGLGWRAFERLRAMTARPVYALGGLDGDDLAEARRHGAQGVAGIRGFWPGPR